VYVGSRPSSELKVLPKLFSYPYYGLGKAAAAYGRRGPHLGIWSSEGLRGQRLAAVLTAGSLADFAPCATRTLVEPVERRRLPTPRWQGVCHRPCKGCSPGYRDVKPLPDLLEEAGYALDQLFVGSNSERPDAKGLTQYSL